MDVVLCLASIAPNAEMTDGDISPTLMARAWTWGGTASNRSSRGERK